jgi:photosystem II stability/assembly factor-like uncharacterized protein
VLFLSAAGFQDKMTSGWYQQYFPNLNGSTIKDLTFLDSLTGFAVTSPDAVDNGYILKTSNGSDNWSIVHTYPPPNGNIGFTKIKFATDSIGYASTDYLQFFKTTNAGLNWINISEPPWGLNDMSVLNKDTTFGVSSSGFGGGVYRSTNGGFNWQTIWTTGGSGNPEKIYMVDKNLGFTQEGSNFMRRTTNGGFNWTLVTGEFFTSIKFFDSNTGWKVYDSIKKTTNGGFNWVTQKTPIYSSNFGNYTSFAILNKDTVWMVGAEKFGRPPVYKTTNGGTNWGYQIPDTNLPVYYFDFVQFVDIKYGWVHPGFSNKLYHTKIGGDDTTYITNINSNVNVELSDYHLFQNYPNPFNPSTTISYRLAKSGNVRIKVFDISGKEIEELVNKKLQAGSYKITFNLTKYSSGIYFYTLELSSNSSGKILSETKRMMLIK